MKSSTMNSEESRAAGLKVLEDLGWPENAGNPNLDHDFWAFTTEHLFGQIWSRPGLSLRDREMITLAVLIAVDADRGVMYHLRHAHKIGITEEELRELIIQVGYYAGWPKMAHAMTRFGEILKEPECTWPGRTPPTTG